MNLSEYNSSEPIFIDANIYIDYALANPQTYESIEDFLEIVELLEINALTSPSVLDEVSYILLMYKGAKILKMRNHREIGNRIKRDGDFAIRCYSVVNKFNDFLATLEGLKILPVTRNDYKHASSFVELYRLLPTDALHAAVMKNNNIFSIATNDTDFNRIEGIKAWKP